MSVVTVFGGCEEMQTAATLSLLGVLLLYKELNVLLIITGIFTVKMHLDVHSSVVPQLLA